MPIYRYRCDECEHTFEQMQRIGEDTPECPECFSEAVTRLIVDAPLHAKGVLTHPGDKRRASKEELRDKWREETPKLRKKLRDKLGDDAVNSIPTLNMNYDDD